MKKVFGIVAGIAVGGAVASLIIHRKVVAARIKGEPMPEPPAWHVWHKPCKKEK